MWQLGKTIYHERSQHTESKHAFNQTRQTDTIIWHTIPQLLLLTDVSDVKVYEWTCVSEWLWTCQHACGSASKKERVSGVCGWSFFFFFFFWRLTSLSLFSYLLAFLPWLFLLSFFRSDWDLSRESCLTLCSIWYLLNVAWITKTAHEISKVNIHLKCFLFKILWKYDGKVWTWCENNKVLK